MANSFLSSIIGMLDTQTVERIAASVGASGLSVSQGIRSSVAAVLGSLASKADDSHALHEMLNLNPPALADTTLSDVARAATEPNSPLISGGRQLLAGLFGPSETAATSAISASSGLRYGTASSLLAMVAPWVLSFVTQRVRAEGLSMTGLGNLLQHESGAIRNALPAGLGDLFWPATVKTASPVVAEAAQTESSSMRWLLPLLALAALVPTLFWIANHSPRVTPPQVSRINPPNFGAVNRAASEANRVANKSIDIVRGALADNVLRFDTGSSKLQTASEEKLNQIASTLKAYPDVHASIAGYTDNVGSAEQNMALSRQRANSVMGELVRKGVSADRLSSEGYGADDPIADNSTAAGRSENRRVTVDVSQP